MRNIRKRFFDVGQINLLDEIIVDSFAGGGGASTGIELAAGHIVDVAINHDPDAILMLMNRRVSGQRLGCGSD